MRVTNVSADPRLRGVASVHDLGVTSLLAVPIPGEAGTIGALYLDSTSPAKSFTAEDEALLARFAGFLGRALGNAVAARERSIELARLQQALAAGMRDLEAQYRFDALIGKSAPMHQLRVTLDHVVRFPYPVLIVGETGTGKELVAKAIHANSLRRDKPLVSVNCAALPRELLESELFGHVKGAFTGADRDRPGLFRSAHQGTLFLDEIGETSEDLQRKLLRVLQEGEFLPVGGLSPQRSDVRIVAATNRNLEKDVEEGHFREDLYFRLKVFKVVLPPLRERTEDIPMLARHLLDKAVRESDATPRQLSEDALEVLARYPWPGNVRELENAMRHALAFSADEIRAEHLPPEVREGPMVQIAREALESAISPGARKATDELWRSLVEKTLEEVGWNQTQAAKLLGISRTTLHYKMAAFGIKPPQ